MGSLPLPRRRHLPRPGRLRLQRSGPPVHQPRAGLRHQRQAGRTASGRRIRRVAALVARSARRHARLLLPPLRRQAAADLPYAGRAGRLPLQPHLRRRHRPLRREPRQEHRRRERGRGSLLPPQHPAQLAGAGHLADGAARAGRHQRAARRHLPRARQCAGPDLRDPGVRCRELGGRTHLGQMGQGA